MLSKPLLALAIASPFNIFAFRPSQRCPHRCRDGNSDNNCLRDHPTSLRRRRAGVPSKLGSATIIIPTLNDGFHHSNITLPPSPVGVIFDMDGTLIQHSIDFADMRRRIYTVADADPIGKHLDRDCVLALSQKLSSDGMTKCDAIFSDIERRALEEMKLMEGGAELVKFLGENGLKKAVLTRNLEKNVDFMRDLYLDAIVQKNSGCGDGDYIMEEPLFHPIVARDTKSHTNNKEPLRSKPHPDGIQHICTVWNCHPAQVIMVGDSANDDMTAAKRAGCGGAVLLAQPGGKQLDTDSGYEVGDSQEEIWERTPSLRVESLFQLQLCLEALLKERDGWLGVGLDGRTNNTVTDRSSDSISLG